MGLTPAKKQRLYRERRKARDREALAALRAMEAEAARRCSGETAETLVIAHLPSFSRALYERGRRDGLREAVKLWPT